MALPFRFLSRRCCLGVINNVFTKEIEFSSRLLIYEEKSQSRNDNSRHSKGGNVLLGAGVLVACVTAGYTMASRQAFCVNGSNEASKEIPSCSTGSGKKVPTRSVIRDKSIVEESSDGGYLRKSLQELSVSANMTYLANELLRARQQNKVNQQKVEKFKGLLELLKVLVVVESPVGFDEAFETYDGYQSYSKNTPGEKLEFRDRLLHPVNGLPVYILFKPNRCHVVAIRPDGSHHTEALLRWLLLEQDRTNKDGLEQTTGLTLNASNTSEILDSMESEWDRKCARVLLGSTRSNSELENLGLDANKVRTATKAIVTGVEECENARAAASDIVTSKIDSNVKSLSQDVANMKDLLAKKRNAWSCDRLCELQEKIKITEEAKEQNIALKLSETPYSKQKLQQMKRRTTTRILAKQRVKKRRLGAGPRDKIDAECEEFIAKAIESKATYHGRRKETVMFTNRRVKVRDLLNIANYELQKRGKAPIKSAVTAWNRSRPRNKRSAQSSKHRGNALFCTKKPPKTEDEMNENTHYQRAHVRNIKSTFFGSTTPENVKELNFMRSIDDKAYLRPGTSEGFIKTRNSRILTVTAEEKARKLPKYDWPERQMYITPSTHRIFTQEPVVVEEKEKLLMNTDRHFVVVRPKAYVDSSGNTWANETERLRLLYPDEFEAKGLGNAYSGPFRLLFAAIHDDVFLYADMSEEGDILNVTQKNICKHRLYEMHRLQHLKRRGEIAELQWNVSSPHCSDFEKMKGNELVRTHKDLVETITVILSEEKASGRGLWESFVKEVLPKTSLVLEQIAELKLPPVKPNWADLTDAGPGVGVSNYEVRFRDAELARIHKSDYRVRVHRSRGDSGQNEAERTNSAIGDSVVDGSTIEWNFYKRFDGLTDEQIAEMTPSNFEVYEKQRMSRNAWRVAEIVRERIDDAPVLGDFITALLAENTEGDNFFFNKTSLKEYQAVAQNKKSTVPGSAYIEKILKFIDTHYSTGELFMEYLYRDCVTKAAECCSYCSQHEWTSPHPMKRIPQPVPDPEKLYHLKSVNETPHETDSGELRVPDDFQPRANIKKQWNEGKLSSPEEIQQFSKNFAVVPQLVNAYISHLQDLKIQSNIRERGRVELKRKRIAKSVEDYAWLELVQSSDIKKLFVPELDKYLKHHKLSTSGAKPDKIKRITLHVLGRDKGAQANRESSDEDTEMTEHVSEGESGYSDSDSDSDDDIVLAELLEPLASAESESDEENSPTIESHVIAENDRLWSVFQSDSDEEEFYGF